MGLFEHVGDRPVAIDHDQQAAQGHRQIEMPFLEFP
jgi:hypothetical protein